MSDDRPTLDTVLDTIHTLGYDEITPAEGYSEEANGTVPLPEQYRRDTPTGLRRFLPRIYCDAGDPDLIPEDLRETVEHHGWTVQAMGRDDETVTVVVSKDGV